MGVRGWLRVAPGELCPARLRHRLRALLEAEAASGGDADEQPLAPFPP